MIPQLLQVSKTGWGIAASIQDWLWEEWRRNDTGRERRADNFVHGLSTNYCIYTSSVPVPILLRYASDLNLLDRSDVGREVSVKEAPGDEEGKI